MTCSSREMWLQICNFSLLQQQQARKPRATLVWNYDSLTHWLTDLLTRVKCRATSVAKNVCSTATLKQRGTRWEEVWVSHLINTNKYFIFHNHTRYMYIHFIYMDISIISYPHTHHQMQKPLNCLAQFISTWRNLLWIIACIEPSLPSSARSLK